MTRARIGSVALVAIVMLLVGCGSSNSSSSSSGSNGSSSGSSSSSGGGGGAQVDAAFAAKVNAICAQLQTQSAALSPPGDPTTATAAQLPAWSTFLEGYAAATQSAVTKIQALGSPASGQTLLAAAFGQVASFYGALQAADTAAKNGDVVAFKSAVALVQTAATAVTGAFDAAGLRDCGSGGTPAPTAPTPVGPGATP